MSGTTNPFQSVTPPHQSGAIVPPLKFSSWGGLCYCGRGGACPGWPEVTSCPAGSLNVLSWASRGCPLGSWTPESGGVAALPGDGHRFPSAAPPKWEGGIIGLCAPAPPGLPYQPPLCLLRSRAVTQGRAPPLLGCALRPLTLKEGPTYFVIGLPHIGAEADDFSAFVPLHRVKHLRVVLIVTGHLRRLNLGGEEEKTPFVTLLSRPAPQRLELPALRLQRDRLPSQGGSPGARLKHLQAPRPSRPPMPGGSRSAGSGSLVGSLQGSHHLRQKQQGGKSGRSA